jgi:hypothetical protein
MSQESRHEICTWGLFICNWITPLFFFLPFWQWWTIYPSVLEDEYGKQQNGGGKRRKMASERGKHETACQWVGLASWSCETRTSCCRFVHNQTTWTLGISEFLYEEILGAHFENASQARECNQRLGEVAATVQQDVLLMAVSATFLMLLLYKMSPSSHSCAASDSQRLRLHSATH